MSTIDLTQEVLATPWSTLLSTDINTVPPFTFSCVASLEVFTSKKQLFPKCMSIPAVVATTAVKPSMYSIANAGLSEIFSALLYIWHM
jgi:hypothetical protein